MLLSKACTEGRNAESDPTEPEPRRNTALSAPRRPTTQVRFSPRARCSCKCSLLFFVRNVRRSRGAPILVETRHTRRKS